uniref:Uncharacterized protein n=1 Tax=Romanomermis culicivorax TaxID=13658 RepID=A0A915JSL1_ROMCU
MIEYWADSQLTTSLDGKLNTYINGNRDTQFDYIEIRSVSFFEYRIDFKSSGNNEDGQYNVIKHGNVVLDNFQLIIDHQFYYVYSALFGNYKNNFFYTSKYNAIDATKYNKTVDKNHGNINNSNAASHFAIH